LNEAPTSIENPLRPLALFQYLIPGGEDEYTQEKLLNDPPYRSAKQYQSFQEIINRAAAERLANGNGRSE